MVVLFFLLVPEMMVYICMIPINNTTGYKLSLNLSYRRLIFAGFYEKLFDEKTVKLPQ